MFPSPELLIFVACKQAKTSLLAMALLLLLRVVALLLGHPGIAPLNPAPGVSSHSLKYFYTAISEDNELLSSFYVVGYMDDQRISQYDSTVRLELPCVSWMKKVEEVDPSYWKDETEVSRNSEQFFKENLVIARNRYNQSRETPEVMVTRKVDHDGMETLICQVGGFYPKDIDIEWTRDGEVWQQDTFHGLVSPNSDGTYYTWKSIKVDPKDRGRYKCHVEHDGLLKPVDLAWEEPASKLGLILGCAMGILLLSTGIAVYFIKWQHDRRITSRCQYGCQAASIRDQKSNISKEAFIPHPSHPRGPRAACNSWQESDEGFGSTEEGLERPQILVSTGNQIPADIKGPLYWGLKGSAQLPPGTWRLI
ncbi:major histocompatibility complex class I-related gene protein-like isoform X6 [Anolis carolinensis]|uniref:major histocompatibility complex class I-related gene protein-like isoform X6 n=1 Tax=Anolis carolinensis TaxID=28377 RepID=UPI002F2B8376